MPVVGPGWSVIVPASSVATWPRSRRQRLTWPQVAAVRLRRYLRLTSRCDRRPSATFPARTASVQQQFLLDVPFRHSVVHQQSTVFAVAQPVTSDQ